jgi:hypothetical protein
MTWDIFISCAPEDVSDVGLPLAKQLIDPGLQVWAPDKWAGLRVGDTLFDRDGEALVASRYVVIIISRACFVSSSSTQLNGLVVRARRHGAKIVPLLHGVSDEDIAKHFPLISDCVSISTSLGIGAVATEISEAVAGKPHGC